jgi:hypothetical protein
MKKLCDAHVHLGKSAGIYHTLHADEISNFITKNGIENLLLMPFELDVDKSNKKIHNLSKLYKQIHGLYWLQKDYVERDAKNISKLLGDGIVGAKFHGTYENLPISNDIYKPVLDVLNDKEAILLVHTGRYKDGDISSNTSFRHAVQIGQRYRKIKLIIAHMGGNDTAIVKQALEASVNIPNIWF